MIYRIPAERISSTRRIARVVLLAVLTAIGTYIIHILWPSHESRTPVEDYVVGEIGVLAAAFFFDSARPAFDLEVTDDFIRTRHNLSGSHKVRRARIRYLREFSGNLFREPALYLSERRGIFRFLLGYVSIPLSLPR